MAFGLGPMWKLIIILVLVIYLLNKISVVLFRAMGRPQPPPPNFRGTANGASNSNGKQTPKRNGGIKGGDYVDYEDVK